MNEDIAVDLPVRRPLQQRDYELQPQSDLHIVDVVAERIHASIDMGEHNATGLGGRFFRKSLWPRIHPQGCDRLSDTASCSCCTTRLSIEGCMWTGSRD